MSILNSLKETLENVSPLNVYLEYDNTPLDSKGDSFVTVGINSDECSYDIQNLSQDVSKDRISFKIRIVMSKDTTSQTMCNYFDNYILNTLMKSLDFNVLSVKEGNPQYTKYLDRMELSSIILVECISVFN